MKIQQAIEMLRGADHAFISKKAVDKICGAFNYKTKCYPGYSTGDPKGLTMAPGNEGALGRDAHGLAAELCRHLNLDYPEMFGRGSQLRVCCDTLEEWAKEHTK